MYLRIRHSKKLVKNGTKSPQFFRANLFKYMYKNNITHSLLFTRKMLRFRIFRANMNLRKWYRMDDSLSDYPYLRVLRTKNLNRLRLVGGEKFQKEILYPSLIRHHN